MVKLGVRFSPVRAACFRPYVALTMISAFTLAIGLGLEIHKHVHFAYHDHLGVVGWVSVHQYPKNQEFFYYLLALIGVPLVMTLYGLGWVYYANFLRRWTSQPVERLLRESALASLPLLLIWRGIYVLDGRLALPIGLTLAAQFGIFLFHRLRPSAVPPQIPPPRFSPIETASAPEKKSRFLSLLRQISAYLLLPVFIYCLIYSNQIHGEIDLFHEGERLAPLNEMLRGGVPFRDIYVQHGVFQNAYLAWLGAQLFSPTLEGVRRLERLVDPFGYVALYLLGLQVFRGGIITSMILVLIASGEHFWVSARHSLGLISFAFIANYITHQQDGGLFSGWRRIDEYGKAGKWQKMRYNAHYAVRFGWKLILAGAFTSLAFWYSTEVGLYTLGAIGLFLLMYSALQHGIPARKRPLPLICYASGAMVGFGMVGCYLLWHGALDDAIRNTYIQCAYQIETWGLAFPSLADTLNPLANSGLRTGWRAFVLSEGFRWYLPVSVFLIAGAYLTYRWLCGGFWHSDGCVKLLLLLLGGVAFFRTALGRSDEGHLIYGSTFLWVLCLFAIDRGVSRMVDGLHLKQAGWKPRLTNALSSAWIILPALAMLWYVREVHHPIRGFQERWNRLTHNPFVQQSQVQPTPLLDRAGNVNLPAEQVEHIQRVVAYIQGQTAPGEKIFDFTSQGAYYFFADRPSVTRYHQVAYASTPAMQREVIDALERDQTRLVIFKTGGWFDHIDGIRSEDRHPLIAQYLKENYELAIDIDGTQILKRKPS